MTWIDKRSGDRDVTRPKRSPRSGLLLFVTSLFGYAAADAWPAKMRSQSRLLAGVVAVVLAAAVAGCGSEESAVDAPNDAGAGVTFPLEPLNDSELEGAVAVVTPLGSDRARIEVDGIVEGSPFGGGPHRVELLRGSCDDPGERAADLGAIEDEEGGGEVEFGLAGLVEGNYAVAVRFVKGSNNTLIACGDIPDTVESSG